MWDIGNPIEGPKNIVKIGRTQSENTGTFSLNGHFSRKTSDFSITPIGDNGTVVIVEEDALRLDVKVEDSRPAVCWKIIQTWSIKWPGLWIEIVDSTARAFVTSSATADQRSHDKQPPVTSVLLVAERGREKIQLAKDPFGMNS
ncbi:hypothetical protein L2E82_15392 [Cichorium intybus]|uniref:Uncharacterized protein n=1 Tax=Cichorium intybus TaxID=13427 RepID=A0ACB9F2P3_CICIN|nr:hypothetical protein L2E82_15392 [Cichorium intybus]